MKLTKYEHACFTVEKQGAALIVDPGSLTSDLVVPNNVVAVIITHRHPDHFDPEHIAEIVGDNPTALIIAPLDITRELSHYNTRPVKGGDSFTVQGFDIDIYGDEHAIIHPDLPRPHNIGILIEDRIFYPGDSFTIPDKSVDTLALPIGAPWLKVSESIEFMKAIGARLTFPTHDATLSAAGRSFFDSTLTQFQEEAGTIYQRLDNQGVTVE